jgi:hypothetical protein
MGDAGCERKSDRAQRRRREKKKEREGQDS